MTIARITPILFFTAALAWAVAGVMTYAGGDVSVTYFALSATFVALGLIYAKKVRSKGEGQNG